MLITNFSNFLTFNLITWLIAFLRARYTETGTYFIKWWPIFDSSPLHCSNSQNSIISFDYSWFLWKNLSDFVSLPWKLHNRYCHTAHFYCTYLAYCIYCNIVRRIDLEIIVIMAGNLDNWKRLYLDRVRLGHSISRYILIGKFWNRKNVPTDRLDLKPTVCIGQTPSQYVFYNYEE